MIKPNPSQSVSNEGKSEEEAYENDKNKSGKEMSRRKFLAGFGAIGMAAALPNAEKFDLIAAGAGGGSPFNHQNLNERDASDSHPWGAITDADLYAVARSKGVPVSKVAYLYPGSLSNVHYLFHEQSETTWWSRLPITGDLTDIGNDVNGIRTITVSGAEYEISSSKRKNNILYITDYLIPGANMTAAFTNATKAMKDYTTLDLCGLTIDLVHNGVNSNPFNPDRELNRTCYAFLEKIKRPKFQNGKITASLDMTSNSLVGFGFAGCEAPEFENIHMDFQCSGIPSYDANGHETFASLISNYHHRDGTKGSGFLIRSNCSFRINHPNGGSIGAKESNPVHNYSGKLVGVEAFGRVDLNL